MFRFKKAKILVIDCFHNMSFIPYVRVAYGKWSTWYKGGYYYCDDTPMWCVVNSKGQIVNEVDTEKEAMTSVKKHKHQIEPDWCVVQDVYNLIDATKNNNSLILNDTHGYRKRWERVGDFGKNNFTFL